MRPEDLIAATTTKTGLKVESALDTRVYEKGINVSDSHMKRLDIPGDAFHLEWSYAVTRVANIVAVIVEVSLWPIADCTRTATGSVAMLSGRR